MGLTGDEVIYEGKEKSFVISGLGELTDYEFKLRAWTEGDEESAVSGVVKATTFRAGRINSIVLFKVEEIYLRMRKGKMLTYSYI